MALILAAMYFAALALGRISSFGLSSVWQEQKGASRISFYPSRRGARGGGEEDEGQGEQVVAVVAVVVVAVVAVVVVVVVVVVVIIIIIVVVVVLHCGVLH